MIKFSREFLPNTANTETIRYFSSSKTGMKVLSIFVVTV